MAGRIILRGAVGYDPLHQGDLDGLCGLYAIINAVCIVSAPVRQLNGRDVRWLMKSGGTYHNQEQALPKVMIKGMSAKKQRKLASHLLDALCQRTGVKLVARSRPSASGGPRRLQLFRTIEDSLAEGAAVLVCLQNTHNHFTVVVGCSETRLYVADSDGLHWFLKSSFGLCEGRKTFRNCVYFSDVFEISHP